MRSHPEDGGRVRRMTDPDFEAVEIAIVTSVARRPRADDIGYFLHVRGIFALFSPHEAMRACTADRRLNLLDAPISMFDHFLTMIIAA